VNEELAAALLEVKDLKVHFKSKGSPFQEKRLLQAVKGVSFVLRRGESLGIVGESGCGKSTIARVLAGIQKLNSGEILFKGNNVVFQGEENLQSRLQMVFQDPFSSLNPRLKVWQQISEPLLGHRGIKDKARLKQAAADLLQQVGLKQADGEKYPHQFSGGQRQRVAIARALALEPEILVADEPTASLDVNSQEEIARLLKGFLQQKNLTMILISHDLTSVRNLTDRVMVLYMGVVMEEGKTADVLGNPAHPYTKALLASAPSLKTGEKAAKAVKGDVPSPFERIPGCPFQSRCPQALERCSRELPESREVKEAHHVACHLFGQEKATCL
jgi:oligopeptide transport system ATP-binding protein